MTIVIRCYERGADFDPDYSKLAHVEYIKGDTAAECMEIVRKYRTRQYI